MDRRLRLEVILAAIDKASGPLKVVAGSGSKMAAALKAAQGELASLKGADRRFEEFRRGADALQANSAALDKARGKMRDLQAQILAAEHPHRSLTDAYKAQRREVLSLERSGVRMADSQAQLSRQFAAAGIPINQLADRQARLRERMEQVNAVMREQGTRLERLKDIERQHQKTIQLRDKMAGTGASLTVAGAAMSAPIINAVRVYSSWEDALLGVQRQVEGVGEVGSVAYKQISAEVKLLGRELPIATNLIGDMYTAASRMEVPRESLQGFVRTVAMMATAFDAVPDEIAEAMGKVAKNFRIPITDIGHLADVINYLDDNAISKASDIIDVLNRTSGVASSVALNEKATAALASTLLTLGERGETAGTAINAIVQKFAAAEKGTKGFQSAMDELGLGLTDIQMGMQKDAQATLFRVIEAIQKMPAGKRTGLMVELVGMEHADTMAKLVTNTQEWRRQIDLANSSAAAGSMEREFEKRTNALSAHWERFKNSIFDVNTESGAALRNTLIGVMTSVGGVLNATADWMRANPGLTAALVKTAAAVAIIVTALGALTLAMAAVLGPFAMIKLGLSLFGLQGGALFPVLMGLAKGALPMLANALRAVLGLLIANPIGATIAALAAAAFLVWQNWDTVAGWLRTAWNEIATAFNGGLVGVARLIIDWSPLGLFYRAFAGVMSYFGVELPAKFTDFGANLLDGMIRGITSRLGATREAISNVGDSVVGWFKDKLGIHSPSRVFAELGGFTMAGLAQGLERGQGGPLGAINTLARQLTATTALGLAAIGPAGAGVAIDNRPPLSARAAAPVAAGGDHIVINIYAAPGMDEEAIGRAVAAHLDRRDREKAARGRARLSDRD